MKKFAFALVCVLCVMFASVLRHVILAKAVPAAAKYSLRPASASAQFSGSMEHDVRFSQIA